MILASKSPRRKEILSDIGFNLEIKSADVEETSDEKDVNLKIMDIARKKLLLLPNNILINLLLVQTQLLK